MRDIVTFPETVQWIFKSIYQWGIHSTLGKIITQALLHSKKQNP